LSYLGEEFIMRHPFDGINGQAQVTGNGTPAAPAQYTRRSVLRRLFTAAATLLGARAAGRAAGDEGPPEPPVSTLKIREEGGRS
jgi:hypothetical protein